MTRHLRALALLFAVAGPAVLAPTLAAAYPPLPPPPVEVVPPPPGPGHIWRRGGWRWNGVRYVWVPGVYVRRRPGYHAWIPGHWGRRGRWIPAHWR
ncbi:hypothetical protein [Lichenicoccus sp.]|uniref:hypothetical protein n=1 Tax=Lichenicoccus sp. TaxID=2781899 RepID=UPI003D11BFA2